VSDETKKVPEWVNCQHSLSLLQEYLEGTLSGEEKAALDRHFKACPPVLDFIRKYKATPGLCQKVLVDEMPTEMTERLSVFVRNCCKSK
jgi:hypothetical protein